MGASHSNLYYWIRNHDGLSLHQILTDQLPVRNNRDIDSPYFFGLKDWEKLKIVKATLRKNRALVGQVDPVTGRLPLHVAAQFCPYSEDVFRHLLKTLPTAASVPDNAGQLPIHIAASRNGHIGPQSIEKLLHVFPDAAAHPDSNGNLPIHLALQTKVPPGRASSEFIDYIVSKLLATHPEGTVKPDSNGVCPIHYLCDDNHGTDLPALLQDFPKAAQVPIVEQQAGSLKEFTAKLTKKYLHKYEPPDIEGWLPIHVLCYSGGGSYAALQALIKAYPDGVKQPDKNGMLPLHLACGREQPQLDIAKCILKAYPEAATHQNLCDGQIPLHIVSRKWGCRPDQIQPMKEMCCGWTCDDAYYIAQSLLSAYPEGVKLRDKYGHIPIALTQHCRIREVLAKANPNEHHARMLRMYDRLQLAENKRLSEQQKHPMLEKEEETQLERDKRREEYEYEQWRRNKTLAASGMNLSTYQATHGHDPY